MFGIALLKIQSTCHKDLLLISLKKKHISTTCYLSQLLSSSLAQYNNEALTGINHIYIYNLMVNRYRRKASTKCYNRFIKCGGCQRDPSEPLKR